jgi:cytochrome c oxidase cbb3-type subunit 3
MNNFLSIFVILIVVGNIVGFSWLLISMRKMPKGDVPSGQKRHHTFDGIEEYNNPLPRWWMWLFFFCNIFAVVYLILYPGLGNYPGVLGWSGAKQWQEQKEQADKRYAKAYENYANVPVPELAKDSRAMKMAERMFINNCAVCHGPNAQGAKGFPNLTTNVWLFGGTPEDLENTIANGRNGIMPPQVQAIGGEAAVPAVANYVLKISGQPYDKALAAQGEPKFKQVCAACHMPDGTGNKALGAPNLTTGKWLFGGTLEEIEYTIRNGRSSQMPAHAATLGKDKVHLLAAYVYHLANGAQK